jgi:DNA-binding HxlR family transcriptional regulator
MRFVRSYGELCPLAKALDVVGDRWSLLIVRELLTRGPCRYTDIRKGVPGIATNLLADRLRELEEAGVVKRESAPPPVATDLFSLTPRGEDLRPVVLALGRWGLPFMAEGSRDEAFQTHWLSLPLEMYLSDHSPSRPRIAIELRTGDEPLLIETIDGSVRARPGTTEHPDAVLSGHPRLIMSVLAGRVDLETALQRGLVYEGSPETLRRVQPLAFART